MTPKSVALTLAVALGGGLALAPASGTTASAPGLATPGIPASITPVANWRHPYRNIDRRYDAGNNTGDAMVERLNEQQLNRIYRGGNPPPGGPMMPPPNR